MGTKTKSFYKSEAAKWEAKFYEMKAAAQRLAAANKQLREELLDARAAEAAERARAEDAAANHFAA